MRRKEPRESSHFLRLLGCLLFTFKGDSLQGGIFYLPLEHPVPGSFPPGWKVISQENGLQQKLVVQLCSLEFIQ